MKVEIDTYAPEHPSRFCELICGLGAPHTRFALPRSQLALALGPRRDARS